MPVVDTISDEVENLTLDSPSNDSKEASKFGTFSGVFTPTVLTILGAVMFLRTGWVVGNAGLGGALLIIGLANVITISTGLSISSVATNIRVRAGGAFSIISQSLGLEVGGSVSVPFYFAQAISVAFYTFAFTEGWLRIFPDHSEYVVVFACFTVAYAIAFISANLAVRIQFLIMTVLFISLISIFLGSFAILEWQGFETFPLIQTADFSHTPSFWGNFADGDFWTVFAVFFPAVTGVLAGVNMSGDLKDPRKNIPTGTMAAIFLTLVIYICIAYWFSRAASAEELINNLTVAVDKSFFGPVILLGILAATFSSALTSLVGAPRILQAIAKHGVLPKGEFLAQETSTGEPRPAMYVTGIIGIGGLLFGLFAGDNGLNAIAPLMTMFFMITYGMLNAVVLLEQSMDLVSFRPLFRVPRLVPLIGLIGCIFVMFLINASFSLVAIIVIIVLYAYLSHRSLQAPWSDVRSGLFVTLAEWAAKQVSSMPTSQERAWKPNLLVPVQSTDALLGSYRFLKALTYPRGSVHTLGLHQPGEEAQVEGLESLTNAFTKDGIFSRMALLEVDDFSRGLRIGLEVLHGVFFRPNALFMPVTLDTDEKTLQTILERARLNDIGTILYAKHPLTSLGREQVINVWIREQSPSWEVGLRLSNLDLSLLLAYQLTRNWGGQINLITVLSNQDEYANGLAFLKKLTSLGRMPHGTTTIVEVAEFSDYLPRAPQADLNIFGVPPKITQAFIERMVTEANASCIFVRDSGNESALA